LLSFVACPQSSVASMADSMACRSSRHSEHRASMDRATAFAVLALAIIER
jgi:hypothetical protein